MASDSPAPEEAIRECPFCGGAAHLSGLGYCGPADCYDVMVICDGCDAQTATLLVDQSLPNVTEQEAQVAATAIAAWNRRAGGEREQRLEEALKEAVLQIEYLHDRFQQTGSGNAVLAKARAALAGQTE